MTPRSAFAWAATLALLLWARPGLRAQSFHHPVLTDYDEPREQHSALWERVLSERESAYLGQVGAAIVLWDTRAPNAQDKALDSLERLAAQYPDRPNAYYWLGQFQWEKKNWSECANAYKRVTNLAPTFAPKHERPDNDLELHLASCLVYSGEFEQGIDFLRRLRTQSKQEATVSILLGEALMALGRLDEAMEPLEKAAARGRHKHEALLALAVALDRGERPALARARLSPWLAENHIRDLHTRNFTRKEDRHYYLALAYQSLNPKSPRALYHYHRFLIEAPQSAWANRVKHHIASFAKSTLGDGLKVTGSARLNLQGTQAAIRKQRDRIARCLQDAPLSLVEVRISVVVGARRPEVKATLFEDPLDDGATEETIACIEKVARTIALPAAEGARGSHVAATFDVVHVPSTSPSGR